VGGFPCGPVRRRDRLPIRRPVRSRLPCFGDLFGAWCLIREWGRIGQGGQARSTPYPTVEAARIALERQRRRKERRGYGLA